MSPQQARPASTALRDHPIKMVEISAGKAYNKTARIKKNAKQERSVQPPRPLRTETHLPTQRFSPRIAELLYFFFPVLYRGREVSADADGTPCMGNTDFPYTALFLALRAMQRAFRPGGGGNGSRPSAFSVRGRKLDATVRRRRNLPPLLWYVDQVNIQTRFLW